MTAATIFRAITRTPTFMLSHKSTRLRRCWRISVRQYYRRPANKARWTWMSRGVARSIFAALDDFARQTHHAEISSAKSSGMGFSGIGAMFGHFVQYAPDRVLAAILANPGQTEPTDERNEP